ncbi:ribosome maturation factor RimM [Arsenophonus symbiont of Ornithomya chloropus]|uniref:ribosome maturation factor RimM n=1 Tax=Arsenophonus symbiont of Ornithomya chloropus TaxID=634121 RepID=UPI0032B1B73C
MVKKKVFFVNPINPIILGKLGKTYGIHGWIKIFSFTENIEDIFNYQPWFVQLLKEWYQLEIEDWKYDNKNIFTKFKNIYNKEYADLMINCKIIIDSGQLPLLKKNEYYWKDLIGCKIFNSHAYYLGHVTNLIATGANDVLVTQNLKDSFGIKERLIPFLYQKVIKKVDIATKIIQVDWDPSF